MPVLPPTVGHSYGHPHINSHPIPASSSSLPLPDISSLSATRLSDHIHNIILEPLKKLASTASSAVGVGATTALEMDHGGHMDHGDGGMDMPMKCSMNMLWNTQVEDTCVVFESWHISSWWGMVVSCILVLLISIFYSLLLARIKSTDRRTAVSLYFNNPAVSTSSASSVHSTRERESEGLIGGGDRERGRMSLPNLAGRESPSFLGRVGVTKLPKSIRVERAALYALSVAISFFLMLVAMTYNAYLFSAVIVGAFIGHMWTEDEMDVGAVLNGGNAKGLACH